MSGSARKKKVPVDRRPSPARDQSRQTFQVSSDKCVESMSVLFHCQRVVNSQLSEARLADHRLNQIRHRYINIYLRHFRGQHAVCDDPYWLVPKEQRIKEEAQEPVRSYDNLLDSLDKPSLNSLDLSANYLPEEADVKPQFYTNPISHRCFASLRYLAYYLVAVREMEESLRRNRTRKWMRNQLQLGILKVGAKAHRKYESSSRDSPHTGRSTR